jgi:chemosensory pili system protein ChpA (sensor histidine kinase/response regulator)
MGGLLQRGKSVNLEGQTTPLPVILIRSADYSVAVQVDHLLGSQEVVVKSLGPQFSMVEGVTGATVMGNGDVVVILDMLALIREDSQRSVDDYAVFSAIDDQDFVEEKPLKVMVTDDSVTVRKVTSRFLERQGFEVVLAKDGQDAVTQLSEMSQLPDVMLLDIEMPRMDGFEVLSRVKHNAKLQAINIVMITSRTGEKHRERALSLGASRYLGKPFQEKELLQVITELTGAEVLEA